jgi:phosphatidylglycerophosphate synthase
MDQLKKVPEHLASPIDNIFYRLSDIICPSMKVSGWTPNMITTVGLVFGLISIYLIYTEHYFLGLIFLWLCFFSDCLDGHFARKYDMVTKFGDYYDHFRDIFVVVTVIILIYKKLKRGKKFFVLTTLIFAYLMMVQIGCQEMNSSFPEHNDCLDIFKMFCPNPELIIYTRFFGCGTFIFVISLFLISLC